MEKHGNAELLRFLLCASVLLPSIKILSFIFLLRCNAASVFYAFRVNHLFKQHFEDED